MKKLCVLLVAVLLITVFAGCELAGIGTQKPADQSTTLPTESKAPSKIVLPLTKQTAIEIALEHAGVTNEMARHLHARQDTDGGVVHYDVDFRSGDYYYAYEISEQTGEILKLETEYERTEVPKVQLTADEVKNIALEHSGFTADSVTLLEIEFDKEDHRYEVEFTKDNVEYTYEICAETGKVLDVDHDWDD